MDWRPPDPSNTEADDSSDANIAPVDDRNATTTLDKKRSATTASDDASDLVSDRRRTCTTKMCLPLSNTHSGMAPA